MPLLLFFIPLDIGLRGIGRSFKCFSTDPHQDSVAQVAQMEGISWRWGLVPEHLPSNGDLESLNSGREK